MPMPIAHGLLGASIVAAIHPQPAKRYFAPLFIGAFLAVAADFDFILVYIFQSRAWHRGFTHSILFALLVCLSFLLISGRPRARRALAYGLAYSSHFLLDFATTKYGGGVELFWFFSPERWQLGWIELSESPSKMPPIEILEALLVEILLFAPLLALVICLRKYVRQDWRQTKGSI